MSKTMKARFACLFLLFIFITSPLQVAPASAAEPVKFTVMVKSGLVRSGPDTSFGILKTVKLNQTFAVTGRTADNGWLRIAVPRLTGEAWIKATLGRVRGSLKDVPILSTGSSTTPAVTTPTPAPVAPAISATGPSNPVVAAATNRAREIYQAGISLGNNPRAFSKVGDCQSVTPYFMASFDMPGQYGLGQYGYLQDTIDNFSGSFSRESVAAMNGLNTAGVLSPLWANAKVCNQGESPLECEYRINRPTITIISLGTNGAWQSDADYEAGLRKIIEISIQRGVVPVLSTKADNVEGGGRFNAIMAKLAAEYDVPLWNFWLAASALPNFGIADTYHLSWGRPFFDDVNSMRHGWAWRNLTALQSLDAVWKGAR